jgi:serine/threonine protein kinase
VKLLEFGIAKLLDPGLLGIDDSPPSRTSVQAMTPEYASPEQARGETITTASDLYSLGVVLYELLTGHRPYRIKSRMPHEIARVIGEEQPPQPSTIISRTLEITGDDGQTRTAHSPEQVTETREGKPERLRARLRGDLDDIVLKALRKEPHARYRCWTPALLKISSKDGGQSGSSISWKAGQKQKSPHSNFLVDIFSFRMVKTPCRCVEDF